MVKSKKITITLIEFPVQFRPTVTENLSMFINVGLTVHKHKNQMQPSVTHDYLAASVTATDIISLLCKIFVDLTMYLAFTGNMRVYFM